MTAYLQSARIWVEAVRDGKSLEQALSKEATWRHLWSTYSKPASVSSQSPSKGSTSGADIPDQLQKEIDILKKQNKTYQSERYVALNKLKLGPQAGNSGNGEGGDGRRRKKRKVELVAARR